MSILPIGCTHVVCRENVASLSGMFGRCTLSSTYKFLKTVLYSHGIIIAISFCQWHFFQVNFLLQSTNYITTAVPSFPTHSLYKFLIHLAHNQYLFLTFRVAQLGYIERSPVKDDKTQKSSPLLANHTSTGAKC